MDCRPCSMLSYVYECTVDGPMNQFASGIRPHRKPVRIGQSPCNAFSLKALRLAESIPTQRIITPAQCVGAAAFTQQIHPSAGR